MGRGGGKRKSTDGMHCPSREEIFEGINNSNCNNKEKAFAAILYLTGARIREIIPYEFAGLRKRKKRFTLPDGSFKQETIEYWFERHWKGLTNNQIRSDEENQKEVCLFENIPTEKRRGQLRWDDHNKMWIERDYTVWRNIPVDPIKDADFLKIMTNYTDKITNQNAPLFKFSRNKGGRIIKRMNPNWFPHLMRHARLTHLAVKEDFKDMELKHITAWKDTRPSEKYVHLQWRDIVRKHF